MRLSLSRSKRLSRQGTISSPETLQPVSRPTSGTSVDAISATNIGDLNNINPGFSRSEKLTHISTPSTHTSKDIGVKMSKPDITVSTTTVGPISAASTISGKTPNRLQPIYQCRGYKRNFSGFNVSPKIGTTNANANTLEQPSNSILYKGSESGPIGMSTQPLGLGVTEAHVDKPSEPDAVSENNPLITHPKYTCISKLHTKLCVKRFKEVAMETK